MNLKLEYEQDFHQWIEHHIVLLKEGKLNEIDVDHLIAELEDMGKSNRRELKSRLVVLIAHLLKWQYQYEQLQDLWKTFTGGSWRATINNQRTELIDLLKDSPSLKRFLTDVVSEAYPSALELVIEETNLPESTFPKTCPYTIEQLLDKKFYPESKS
jgi:hypothetical protein